jgi:hypothetical protein
MGTRDEVEPEITQGATMKSADDADEGYSTDPVNRHLCVEDRAGLVIVRFINLNEDLKNSDSIFEIGRELEGLVKQNHPRSLILDFESREIDPIADTFYAVLVRLFKQVKQTEGRLMLCNQPPGLVEMFRINQLIKIFPPYESLDDALAGKECDPSRFSKNRCDLTPLQTRKGEAEEGVSGRIRRFLVRARMFLSRNG